MPRTPRRIVPGHPHHIVMRGNNRRRLFSFASDYAKWVALMASALEHAPCALHAFVLMANHVHLLMTPLDARQLSAFAKHLCQRYAHYRNRTREGSGKLFEERFYAEPIRNDNHFGCTIAYIELNPLRAGIVSAPEAYRWSTFRLHAGLPPQDRLSNFAHLLTPASWYVDLANNAAARADRYRAWTTDFRERGTSMSNWPVAQAEHVMEHPKRRLLRPDNSRAS